MPTNTYVALDKITVGSKVSQVTFTGINQGYTDLVVVVNGSIDSFGNVRIQVGNGSVDTGSNYSWTRILGDGSTAQSDRGSSQTFINAVILDTNLIGNSLIHLQNYSNTTTFKTVLTRGNSTGSYVSANVGLWRSTSAIERVRINGGGADFNVGTTFSLYGIAASGVSPAAKATGGAIYSDDLYYYHVFGSTGTFTPLQSLTADMLVVAGGAGGGNDAGGGGGAGGLLNLTSQSLSATGYTVTVGAGGAAQANGNNSQFGALTAATAGGRGAYYNGNAAQNGGSGGGGGGNGTTNYGTGTSGQGNNGGNGGGGAYTGGGGGGAGAVGGNAGAVYYGGIGGVGSSSYSAWGTATGTGQLVSGTYYYAGGGGGGGSSGSSNQAPGGYGGGGYGHSSLGVGQAGTANTGGGGGGGWGNGPGGTAGGGGSGIVIVRYAK